ncbi:hypothetical protein GGTG_13697 [Gaeumannomyces tritici R3-111a-1]|uniref:Hsp70-like protein n=1 Tax=Gaeumannomyces tritici (strain R3-111a-1) TaxID=644352 RepID=J3PJL1_GAET3|nr:hypothetical protein GGTG_13697 [Gaeumannomyces tritici R3-111a-1]EJT68732.1 hypothetical protein GGTG_13697 [Gaeumannomyces tritici R3-111a-1]
MAQARIVIGLDFGTTFSGVAYSDKPDAPVEQINVVQTWKGAGSITSKEKVPSRIAYLPPPPGQSGVRVVWGDEIKPHQHKVPIHACMKLRLDDKHKLSPELKELMTLLSADVSEIDKDINQTHPHWRHRGRQQAPPAYPGKNVVEIITDLLSEIRVKTYDELKERYGDAVFASMRKELMVTVPAVWSERAKGLTLQAVVGAGWAADKISTVTEPEAAATYTLRSMIESSSKVEIDIGNTFVLCDAGGGTVDLISYKITHIEPRFHVEEAAVGHGEKCGASFIDKEFLSWLQKWIGATRFNQIPFDKKRHGSRMMKDFEANKLGFDGTDEGMAIRLPSECGILDDSRLQMEDGTLFMTGNQMKQVFKPCVDRVLKLITSQVDAVLGAGHQKPKMVFLVGGFGKNDYLYKMIEKFCLRRRIQIRRPHNPWSAIARGAVCRGLELDSSSIVAVRLSRGFFGVGLGERFDASKHSELSAYICPYTSAKMASGQMSWLLKKSERLPQSNPKVIKIAACTKFFTAGDARTSAKLVTCSEDVAPTDSRHHDVYPVCTVHADMTNVPIETFEKEMNFLTGVSYYEATFELEAQFQGGNITWRCLYQGQEVGSTTVTYDF